MSPIHLIYSSSYRITEEELKKIVKDNPYTKIDNNIVSIEEIIEECNYQSFFDEEKYIVVKNCSLFSSKRKNKDEEEIQEETEEQPTNNDEELLIKYIDNPNPKTILIFISPTKPNSTKKLVKKIKDKYNLIELSDMKYQDIMTKIEKYLKDNKYTYEKEILYYITSNCDNNYDLVINQLDKIMLYYSKPTKILLKDVKELITKPLEDNSFKLYDAILKKDLKEAMSIFDDLMIQKVQPVMLLIVLSKEYRNILITLKMKDKYSKDEIMSKLGLSKNTEFKLNNYINLSYSYKEKELEQDLLLFSEYNSKMISGNVNPRTTFEVLMLQLCK